MNIFRVVLLLIFCMGLVCADNENSKESKKVGLILASFLDSLRTSDWERIYQLHTREDREIILGDAIVNLYHLSGAEDVKAKAAEEILHRFYRKEEADTEVKNSKLPLTQREEMLMRLRHVVKPEKLYSEWRKLEAKGNDFHENLLKKIATENDFEITVDQLKASAKGESKDNIEVNFIKEDGGWKIVSGWYVQK